MHNLGCDLNAKYKHTQALHTHPPLTRSRTTNRAPWLARVIFVCVQQQWETDPLHLLLVSIYLLLLLLGVGSGAEWGGVGGGGGSQCAAGPRECFHKQEHVL